MFQVWVTRNYIPYTPNDHLAASKKRLNFQLGLVESNLHTLQSWVASDFVHVVKAGDKNRPSTLSVRGDRPRHEGVSAISYFA